MKRSRHDKIIELVQKYDIETQEDLVSKLREAGYEVTQATVSRDIRQMRLTKIAGRDGKQKYFVMPADDGYLGDKYSRVLKEGFVSIEAAMNPATTDYLYFVAGSDKRHTFSKEYGDHLKAKSAIESKKEGE